MSLFSHSKLSRFRFLPAPTMHLNGLLWFCGTEKRSSKGFNIRVCFDLFGPDENLEFITKKKFLNSTGSETRPLNTLKYTNSVLHNSCHPSIRDGSTWSKFGARGEHGDVYLFSNLGALWFSENLIRYSLHVFLREVKNNLFSFKHSYLRHFSWRFLKF